VTTLETPAEEEKRQSNSVSLKTLFWRHLDKLIAGVGLLLFAIAAFSRMLLYLHP
jgi:hypothetical protein